MDLGQVEVNWHADFENTILILLHPFSYPTKAGIILVLTGPTSGYGCEYGDLLKYFILEKQRHAFNKRK
jgi:hypothetical protein